MFIHAVIYLTISKPYKNNNTFLPSNIYLYNCRLLTEQTSCQVFLDANRVPRAATRKESLMKN